VLSGGSTTQISIIRWVFDSIRFGARFRSVQSVDPSVPSSLSPPDVSFLHVIIVWDTQCQR
jgi:hypothetical protein